VVPFDARREESVRATAPPLTPLRPPRYDAESFEQLAARGATGPHGEAVDVDLARTPLLTLWRDAACPFGSWEDERVAALRESVADLCRARVAARPLDGYCQGLDYVAAQCLAGCAFDAKRAHVLLRALLDDVGLAGVFAAGLPQLKRRCLELRLLLDARCPELAKRLRSV